MTTPKTNPDDLMPWVEIADQLRMPVAEVRRAHDKALLKLRKAFEAQGFTIDEVRQYFAAMDARYSGREQLIQYMNLHYPHLVDVNQP